MCRWLAYSGAPILLKDALYEGPTRWSTRACTRGSGPSRLTVTDSALVGTGPLIPQVSIAASSRRGTTRTSASSPATSVRRCSSPIFARRSAAPCSRRTATRSATTIGCLCITAISTSSPDQARSGSRRRSVALPGDQGSGRHRGAVFLALTFGLEDDPPAAVEQAIGLVEDVAERHGVPHPFQGTVATTDGESIWAFRYSSERQSRSLFYTTDVPTLRKLYPERELFREVSENARLIVSEPLGDVAGVWNEVPESTWGVIGPDREEMRPFRPKAPPTSVPLGA